MTSRITLGKIPFAWAVLLWWAGMVLPNLDSHTRAHPVAKAIIAVVYSMLVIGRFWPTRPSLSLWSTSADWRNIPIALIDSAKEF